MGDGLARGETSTLPLLEDRWSPSSIRPHIWRQLKLLHHSNQEIMPGFELCLSLGSNSGLVFMTKVSLNLTKVLNVDLKTPVCL